MANLVQMLLPLTNNDGQRFDRSLFDDVRRELTERFGGATAYSRVPAEGVWRDDRGTVARDDVIIVEVMCDDLDRAFWARYREELAGRFAQQELVVRAIPFESL